MFLAIIALIIILAFLPFFVELAAAIVIIAIHLIKWALIIGVPLAVIAIIVLLQLPG